SALAAKLGRSAGAVLSLPAYLSDQQVIDVRCLASSARINLLGSLPSPLAAVLAAYGDEAGWPDPQTTVLVIDVDGYALTWAIRLREGDELRLRQVRPSPHLARGAWLRRLMDGAAHRCVRQSRRDPRTSPETDQELYEQLSGLLNGPAPSMTQIRLQGAGWYH